MTETSETSMPPRVLECTRVFDAPRELVFRCMIEPEKLVWEEPEFGITTTRRRLASGVRWTGSRRTLRRSEGRADESVTSRRSYGKSS
jgi:uncharacterized protein YndB with AHSA1/START domain